MQIGYNGGVGNDRTVYVQLPFGPSANYKNMSEKDSIDWSNIAEIRYCMFIHPGVGTLNVCFDGFRFIKKTIASV